jgi:hypothetical protein
VLYKTWPEGLRQTGRGLSRCRFLAPGENRDTGQLRQRTLEMMDAMGDPRPPAARQPCPAGHADAGGT